MIIKEGSERAASKSALLYGKKDGQLKGHK